MDQVSKILLLNQMIENYTTNVFDIDDQLDNFQNVALKHSSYFKDKTLHDQYISTLGEMKKLNETQKDIRLKKIKKLQDLLRKEETKIFQRDYYNYSYRIVDSEVVAQRQLPVEGFTSKMKTTISYYCDWKWAGVQLNPGSGEYTDSMIACDPLYLLNDDTTNMSAISHRFNRFFAEKRLFPVKKINKLPQEQIGMAININAYEFMPIDPIKCEMRKVLNALCPGGYFIFTYNDCEKQPGINFCMEGYRCYNTKSLMSSLAQGLGFDIVKTDNFLDTHSWMVVKKPGVRTSQKLSAPLVKIVRDESKRSK